MPPSNSEGSCSEAEDTFRRILVYSSRESTGIFFFQNKSQDK